MKRNLIVASLALAIIMTVLLMAVGALGGSNPSNYAEYGQKTLYAEIGGAAPSIDGVVAEGEYYNTFVFNASTPGVRFNSDSFTGYPSTVKVGITTDNDFIYLGITVDEPYYKYRVGGTAGSYMAFSFGFNMGDIFYQCMDRQTLTLSVYDDKTAFVANTIMVYGQDGKAVTTYNSNIYVEKAFIRDDLAKLTTYEVQLSKAELAANSGLTKLPETCYIHFLNKTYDSAGNNAEFQYRCALDATTQAIITAQDGWCASFAPHLLTFLAPGAVTTAAPVITTAPVTTAPVTTAPVTTAPVTTEKVTTAAVTTEIPAVTTAATTAAATTASGKDKGCGSSAAIAVLPLLFVAIPAIRRRKD